MRAAQLQNLLTYINSLSLSPSNRKWLADHIVMPSEEKAEFTEEEFKNKLKHSSQSAENGQAIRMHEDETSQDFIDRLLCM